MDPPDLATFVQTTIDQVFAGIKGSVLAKDKPDHLSWTEKYAGDIEFDLAVEAAHKTGGESTTKMGVVVRVLQLGKSRTGSESSSTSTVSRIRFKVFMPKGEHEWRLRGKRL